MNKLWSDLTSLARKNEDLLLFEQTTICKHDRCLKALLQFSHLFFQVWFHNIYKLKIKDLGLQLINETKSVSLSRELFTKMTKVGVKGSTFCLLCLPSSQMKRATLTLIRKGFQKLAWEVLAAHPLIVLYYQFFFFQSM